jgi:hypothetical protein
VTAAVARAGAAALVAAGVITAVHGLITAPARTWANLLLDGFYVGTLAVSAMFFLATQRLAGARWSAGLRRIPEAFATLMPVGAAAMLLVFVGRHALYPWADSHAHLPGGRAIYLHGPFVLARMVVVVALWCGFAWLFRRWSLAQDHQRGPGALDLQRRLDRVAAVFLPLFALTFTVAAQDWLLSLDPHWASTMFAVYVFAGTFVQGIAAITLVTVILHRRGLLDGRVGDAQLHDLGKLLFAFSTFWAYIWTCQYLLIWYGNIPEEVTFFAARTSPAWLGYFALTLVINWMVPFVLLMPAPAKRNPAMLLFVSVALLFGHWLDLFVLIMPAAAPTARLALPELLLAAGYLGLVYLLFTRSLRRAPLVPAIAEERP